MKKLLFAWIEEVFRFDNEAEAETYVKAQEALAERKRQDSPVVISMKLLDDGFVELQIRKPYNANRMKKG